MNTKNILLGGMVGTIFIFIYDMVVHGMMLWGTYEATADVWRPMSEMEAMFPFSVAMQAALAFAMAIFVAKKHVHGAHAGARFGCMIGVFLAIMSLTQYSYLPIELSLPVIWAVSILVSMTAVGAIAGYFNRGH